MLLVVAPLEADEEPWGEPQAGLQIGLAIEEGPAVGARIGARVQLRNVSSVAMALPTGKNDAFGWLIVQQGKKQWFSIRLDLGKGKGEQWPATLPAGKTITVVARDIGPIVAYTYRKGLKFMEDFKAGRRSKEIVAGALHKVLRDGPVFVKFYLYAVASKRPTLLKSNFVQTTLAPPTMTNLSPADQKAFVADLLKRFDRDAWSAMAACGAARKIGKPILDDLIVAVSQTKRPGHSRMWLATAVCGIHDPRSVAALTKLLRDGVVQSVVAYHGAQQRSKELDAAIIARAKEIKATRFTGYALLGCLSYRKNAPLELLKLGLDSPDARTRAAAAEVFRHIGGGSDTLGAMTRLLDDKEPRVRATAARVLGNINNRTAAVLGPLVSALKHNDDLTRQRVCAALSQLAAPSIQYDPKATAEQKARVLKRWRDWWAKQPKS